MSSDLQAYLRDPGPEIDRDYAGLLHQALHEVLRLSPAVVEPLEAQIESEYQEARKEAQERFERDKARITGDLQSQSQEIRQRYEAELQAAQADFESRLSTLKVEVQQKRKKIMEAAAELESKAEKERQDQTMVAEFVAEGAATKRQQKSLKAKTNAEEIRYRLDDLGQQADQLVRLYRQGYLTTGEQTRPAIKSGPNPSEVLREQQALAEQHLETLGRLCVAQLFVGGRPVLFAGGLLGAALALLTVLYLVHIPGLPSIRVAVPALLALVGITIGLGGRVLWHRSRRQVRQTYGAFREALTSARAAREQQLAQALQDVEHQWQTAVEQKQAELKRAQTAFETSTANIAKQRNTSLHQLEEQGREAAEGLRNARDQAIREAEEKYQQQQTAFENRFQQDFRERASRGDSRVGASLSHRPPVPGRSLGQRSRSCGDVASAHRPSQRDN
jgi:hypothetical protein